MTMQISVEARVLGEQREEGIGTMSVTVPAQRLSGAELVRLTVEEQVRTLTARRRLTALEIEQRLNRQYGALPQTREVRIGVPELDAEQEAERALQACRAGECLVVINGQPLEDLKREVFLAPETTVQFLRVLPMAGG